ncbi:UMP kinase [Tumebacillus permanentifrigoris]|uniref:Uridylate kinase n=1 Tax=Tumebacillus permanentifrigoris TaxID=378543 RepID=A0A316D5M0_9BACL|nr:UMP kinase [Tumebacillus permanentifrigoris]PWK08970.1 uridylate kinase [Tumebacillus permanentifrigoris]
MERTRYERVLIKLSGGALAGDGDFGFDPAAIEHIVSEVQAVCQLGVQVCIVIGGGNIFRGNVSERWGIERAEADNIGVMGTVINSLMLRGALTAKTSKEVRVMTSIPMNAIAEPYIRLRAVHHMEKGYIVILAGGTGQPYVTTDYPAVQRALELRCDAIMVAKHGVDGVYTADPKLDPNAKRFKTIGYGDVVREDLKVMDQSAMLLARDYGLPIHVFNFDNTGEMKRICLGDDNVGTYISPTTARELAY